MSKLKVTQKEYQILNPLLINMIRKKEIFHQIKNTGMSLNNKTIALNILYIPQILEKYDMHTSRNII